MIHIQDVRLPPAPGMRTILVAAALFTAGFLAKDLLSPNLKPGVTRSPRTTLLPLLSKQEQQDLPYPPDALPGARDVETPYGTFRVYEWGPEDGPKVLLVHGISTPCLSLGGVAHGLAEKGCRVMLFDLPGRGYSDNPTDVPHDTRFFMSQILIVLASSPLSWAAGSGGFALVGYSLGGGIGASFTSYFPEMVNSLIMIAPAGVIRDHHISMTTRVLFSKGVFPEPLLQFLVRRRLQKPISEAKKKQPSVNVPIGASQAVKGEIEVMKSEPVTLSKSHPDITIEAAVNHQTLHHKGFVDAFMSSIRYGPVRWQHDRWRRIGERLTIKNCDSQVKEKVLIILGKRDPVIILDELKADAAELLENNVKFEILSAGHEVPISKAEEVADLIWAHLQECS